MDLDYSDAELAFRDEVRAFLATALPDDLRDKVKRRVRLVKDDYVRWHRILAGRGWVAPGWPREYGGPGWTPVQRHLFDEECARAGTPPVLPFGVGMVGPVLIAFGSDAQKSHWLPRILRCDDWWCQGYSEPGAGSDLAALKTSAVRDGAHYVLNGQKTWTTLAQYADMMFCLVRTDPAARKQDGISFLLVDMRTPGITVRPIRILDEECEVNEVFFDDVRVPVGNLVGQENRGWTLAKYLLGHERTGIAGVGRSKQELARLKELARREHKDGRPLIGDPLFAAKVFDAEIELLALETTVLRVLAQPQQAPGPEASLLKVRGTELQQRIAELLVDAAGPLALPFDPGYLAGETPHSLVDDDLAAPLLAQYFNGRKTSIYGGSNEIQRNIIAQMILGL